jgi:hypothetical protein
MKGTDVVLQCERFDIERSFTNAVLLKTSDMNETTNAFECFDVMLDSDNDRNVSAKKNRGTEHEKSEIRIIERDLVTFCGGPVETIDWLNDECADEDIDDDDEDEDEEKFSYLAVEARARKFKKTKVKTMFDNKNNNKQNNNACIQIYRVSRLGINVEFLLAHDCAFATTARWMPNLKFKTTAIGSTSETMKQSRDALDEKVEELMRVRRNSSRRSSSSSSSEKVIVTKEGILGYLGACLGDGSVRVWAIPKKKTNNNSNDNSNNKIEELDANDENILVFKGEVSSKSDLKGPISMSWSEGIPGRLAVGTVDGSVCIFDVHRCIQYEIDNFSKIYSNINNSNRFSHPPSFTVTINDAGSIRDIEFAPLERNASEDADVTIFQRKKNNAGNIVALAANKVAKAIVIDLRSRSVVPESASIEKWMDDVVSLCWLPKGSIMFGCDGSVNANGKYLLRQFDGLVCWEDEKTKYSYSGTLGFKLPDSDYAALKDSKKKSDYATINAGGIPWTLDSRYLGTRRDTNGSTSNKCALVVCGSTSGIVSATIARYRTKENKKKDNALKAQGSWRLFELIGGVGEDPHTKYLKFRTQGDNNDVVSVKSKTGPASKKSKTSTTTTAATKQPAAHDDDDCVEVVIDATNNLTSKGNLECHKVRIKKTGGVWIASGFVNGFVRVQLLNSAYVNEKCDALSEDKEF